VTVLAKTEKDIKAQSLTLAWHGRAGQCLGAVLALLVFGPSALLTVMFVWFSLGRPLLFRQVRSGLGGRPFTVAKFRTMLEIRDGRGQLLPDAERETAVTRFIRAVRFDEIPQLLAILRGDMNFVGPRPLQPSTVAVFGTLGAVRGKVRPGLTGWAQVNGNTRLSDPEKLALDIWYIDHRSAKLDAWILLLTAVTVLRGERRSMKHIASALAHLHVRTDDACADVRLGRRVDS
jgi:lipopolysaccharide/colanic/teichoic acid biosynthesis glycosyltransferase